MPHGNNRKKQSNNKKKGRRGREDAVAPLNTTPGDEGIPLVTPSTSPSSANHRTTQPTSSSPLPTFHSNSNEFNGQSSSGSLMDSAKDVPYIRYKKSTQRIKAVLQSMVPAEIFETDSVNALIEATDYIVQHGLEVSGQLLNDLKYTIRVRRQFADDKYGGGDEGHSHFIAVLVYCWSHLRPHRFKRHQPEPSLQDDLTVPQVQNRFELLSPTEDSDDDDDEYNDDVDLPSKPPARPLETGPTRLTLQELISGTDRSDTILFLMSLGELMKFNANHFVKLKEMSECIQRNGHPPNIIIEQMMEASVACNFAIQQVASLEQVFISEHPHLDTVYRLFAGLVYVDTVRHVTMIVGQKSPIASHFTEKHAIQFLGDALECGFRNQSDPHNKSSTLVKNFLERWKFKDGPGISVPAAASMPVAAALAAARAAANSDADMSIQQIFDSMQCSARLEAGMSTERLFASLVPGMTSHDWLRDDYIGKNRSITQTIRLLQSLSNLVKKQNGRLVAHRGWFGTSWDLSKRVERISVDMDELLMADVLPSLINICYDGMMSKDLPFQDELLTGFVQIKNFVKYPERPVSWSLAFTVHTILTSIFEVQGSSHFMFLAETAKQSFEKYMKQLEWARATVPSTISRRPPHWDVNIRSLLMTRLLPLVQMERTHQQTMLSLWNPFCAGAFLSFVAYYVNLEGGTSLVDSVAQLRMTLHLFNALKQVGAMESGRCDVLDWIFETFKSCKAMWEGPLPTKGQLAERWSIASGLNALVRAARQQCSESPNDPARAMTRIQLDHLSKSYRRICLRDFRGVVDKYHTRKQRRKKDNPIYKVAVRINDTLDAMEDDEQLLATNLICLGYYLNQFCIDLFVEFGWMPLVEYMARERPPEMMLDCSTDFRRVGPNSWEASADGIKYQTMSRLFAGNILTALDAGDVSLAPRCAEFMRNYFNSIPPDKVLWFLPTRREE